MGQRILSMVMGFFWSPEPYRYCVRLAYRLLGGTKVRELLFRTPYVRGQFYRLASGIFRIGCVNYTHLFVWRVPPKYHTTVCSPLHVGYVLLTFGILFLMKRRSLLDALSSSTLSPLLASSMLLRSLFRCFLGLFRAFFFEFSHLLGLFNNFFGLAFRELLILSSKNLKHGDNSGHFYLFRGF